MKDPTSKPVRKRPQVGDRLWAPQSTRCIGLRDLYRLFTTFPKEFRTLSGDTLSIAVLRFVGSQAVAVSCREALDWWTIEGRRLVLVLNDERSGPAGPFAPLERTAIDHVEHLRFGRYGRRTVEEYAGVMSACAGATSLRCVYSKMAGFGIHLEQLAPRLRLRTVKLHQCRIEAGDLARLMRMAPQLEAIDCYGEALQGLGAEFCSLYQSCPNLRSVEFNDCSLAAQDLSAFLVVFGGNLQTLHIQANDLSGLRVRHLAALESLSLVDCRLTWEDAAFVVNSCPRLEVLVLCGNPMSRGGGGSESDENGCESSPRSWSCMTSLRRADFRSCGLDSEDEEELRNLLPETQFEFKAKLPEPTREQAGRHVVFKSSSSESECSV